MNWTQSNSSREFISQEKRGLKRVERLPRKLSNIKIVQRI